MLAFSQLQAQSADLNTDPPLSDPHPNPTNTTTKITYNLSGNQNANLRIYDMVGKQVKSVTLSQVKGEVLLDVSMLHSGMYFCTIETEGKTIATKRLVIKD